MYRHKTFLNHINVYFCHFIHYLAVLCIIMNKTCIKRVFWWMIKWNRIDTDVFWFFNVVYRRKNIYPYFQIKWGFYCWLNYEFMIYWFIYKEALYKVGTNTFWFLLYMLDMKWHTPYTMNQYNNFLNVSSHKNFLKFNVWMRK